MCIRDRAGILPLLSSPFSWFHSAVSTAPALIPLTAATVKSAAHSISDAYVLRVFIHADWDFRMEKAAEKLSMSQKEIEKFLQKDDKRKDEYYRRFTGEEWKDATQYDPVSYTHLIMI